MADNQTIENGDVGNFTTVADEITSPYTGGTAKAQAVKLLSGAADANTVVAAGGGVEANALRVTIANDSTGVISIDDNGGAITVDGTVTANLGATDNAVLDAIQAAVEVLDNIVAGAEAQVDVVTVPAPLSTTGGGTEAAALRVTIANNSTGVVSVDDNAGSLTVDGSVGITGALPAGMNNIGDVDIASALPAGSNTIGAVTPLPLASGGCSIFRSLDLDETEEEVKATAGTLYGYYIANLATTTRFVKFYNATAATVVVGTTVPVLTLPIPSGDTLDVGANMLGGVGIKFDTAITVAATTGVADADTGAPGANEVVVNLFFL